MPGTRLPTRSASGQFGPPAKAGAGVCAHTVGPNARVALVRAPERPVVEGGRGDCLREAAGAHGHGGCGRHGADSDDYAHRPE